MHRLVESLDISRLKDSHGRISQVLLSQTNARPTWFSSSPSISTWSWFFILTYKWPFTNTPEKKRKQWLKLEIEKKTDKFLFHKNVTPGTLQRSIFFSVFPSLFSLPSPHLNVPRATEQHTVPLEKQSPDVPRLSQSPSLSHSFSPVLCLFSTLSRLPYSPVPCMCEEHCRRAMVEWVVTGWSSSSLYCSLDQYWDMSGSLPGTWTGTDTPGEMSPAETRKRKTSVKKKTTTTKQNRREQKTTCYIGWVDAPCTVSVTANSS